jgi:DNA-binding CsgD family transcriptional regulator
MARALPGPGREPSVLGRAAECRLLDDLIADIRRGNSRSLVLRGNPGIGKTALLEYLVAAASELIVVRAEGVQSEMELAYAGLHQLCAGMIDRLPRLPTPQRQALEIVFGLSAGAAPDRFLVGLGVLSLLSEVGEEHPLLCVVDDAQWLDRASAMTLAFVARRLKADRVGIVFAAREPGEELQDAPMLNVRGLSDGDARRLLGSAVPVELDERVLERIVAEAHGNPLALLELPRGLTGTQLAAGVGRLGAEALSGQLEDGFVRRLEALPENARLLLLVAAAEPVGDSLLLWRAAERLGIAPAAAEAAQADGLLTIGVRVTFRHPLVRSAVYHSAPVQDRRSVHLALAEATDPNVDPDRRAWHLAAAAAGPDEQVAVELERSARRAQASGGLAAAAAFLARAVALTQDPTVRGERALAAAEASLEAGALDVALGLVGTAESAALDQLQSARVLLVRARIAFTSRRRSDTFPLLLKAARGLEAVDANLARASYLEALHAALHAGRFAGRGVVEVSEAVLTGPPAKDPPRPADRLLDGLAIRFTQGYAAAAPILRKALSAFRCERLVLAQDARWLWLACRIATDAWDEETEAVLCTRGLRRAREAGALAALPFALSNSASVHAMFGELNAAASKLDELQAVSEAAGMIPPPEGALWVAAVRGRESEAPQLMDRAASEAVSRGEGLGSAITDCPRAILFNGLSRYDEALAAVGHAGEQPSEIGSSTRGIAELVEAAARSGRDELAQTALERLAERTRASGTEWALGVEARSRALLAEETTAEGLYREAIERLGRTRLAPELARAHLLFGEWLRREQRRVDARTELRVAHEQFTSIGMEAFSERARQELLATGEKARKRTAETRDDLTAQERQIAELARDGLSNPEIGARLFLSPRTVEWHLRKVFGKLGIRSRHELADALAGSKAELVKT